MNPLPHEEPAMRTADPAPPVTAHPSPSTRLATDWDDDVASTDTLTRQGVRSLAHRISHAGRRLGRPVLERDDVVAADHGSASPFVNMAVLLRPLIGDADASRGPALAALRHFFPAGRPWLLISAWPTSDLAPRLHLVGHPPFMARPVGPVPPEL